jgi:hypothetical protein
LFLAGIIQGRSYLGCLFEALHIRIFVTLNLARKLGCGFRSSDLHLEISQDFEADP